MSFVWFILLVGVLITVHELGHFAVARALGIGVLKLSIGFGPPLLSIRRRGTEYAISLVPLGGYVRLRGEEGEAVEAADEASAFSRRPAWQRLLVIVAGPAANVLFAVLVFAQLYARETTTRSSTIGSVLDGETAAGADLRPGDHVVAVDGRAVRTWDELVDALARAAEREVQITVERAGVDHVITKVVTPRLHRRRDVFGRVAYEGMIGVAPHYRLPQIGVVGVDTPAWRAGLRTFDVITSIQGRAVRTHADLKPLVAPESGAMLLVTFVRPSAPPLPFAAINLLQPESAQVVPDAAPRAGKAPRFDNGLRLAELFIYAVEPRTPAATLGLEPGDMLLAIDGQPLRSWDRFEQALEERPDEEHRLRWRSKDGEHEGGFHLLVRRQLDEYQGEWTRHVFGAESASARLPVAEVPAHGSWLTALLRALGHALAAVGTLVRAIGLTLVGVLPATSVGGPLTIYQAAGVAAQHGFEEFLLMAALVSLNLGVLNLLPVPLLDGGQAAILILARVRGRELSPRARRVAGRVGIGVLVALLLLALHNDIARMWS